MAARILRMQGVHSDDRRTISEVDVPTETGFGIGRMTLLEINAPVDGKPVTLGDHYHMEDRERFLLTRGRGVLTSCHVSPVGQLVGPLKVDSVQAGDVIVIEPFVAHTFVFDGPATLVCVSSMTFDPKDTEVRKLMLPPASARMMHYLRELALTERITPWDVAYYSFHGELQVTVNAAGTLVVSDNSGEGAVTLNFNEGNLEEVLAKVAEIVRVPSVN
ncbi:MAG TPA: hypothetical protein VLA77_02980 [Candidatus Saccharimonadales bacterium]|nr:hypothetical protein [Candidatus Saccharimonadales bacterium]